MVGITFDVYDNVNTFWEHNANDPRDDFNRLKIIDMWLKPPHCGFWFSTDMIKIERNVDIHSPYVHIHEGSIDISNAQYDPGKEPRLIDPNKIKYDPNSKWLSIKDSILPWKEPVWQVHTSHYYGSEIPEKKTPVMGAGVFDYYRSTISFILGLYPSRKS